MPPSARKYRVDVQTGRGRVGVGCRGEVGILWVRGLVYLPGFTKAKGSHTLGHGGHSKLHQCLYTLALLQYLTAIPFLCARWWGSWCSGCGPALVVATSIPPPPLYLPKATRKHPSHHGTGRTRGQIRDFRASFITDSLVPVTWPSNVNTILIADFCELMVILL